ncbi:MAG: hypothetical protein ACLGH0_13100 [Thermoanaerobaculia bacterium]
MIALSLLPFLTPNRNRLLRDTFEPVYTACNAASRLLESLLSVTPEQAELIRNPLLTNEARTRVAALRESVVTLLDDAYPPLLAEIYVGLPMEWGA